MFRSIFITLQYVFWHNSKALFYGRIPSPPSLFWCCIWIQDKDETSKIMWSCNQLYLDLPEQNLSQMCFEVMYCFLCVTWFPKSSLVHKNPLYDRRLPPPYVPCHIPVIDRRGAAKDEANQRDIACLMARHRLLSIAYYHHFIVLSCFPLRLCFYQTGSA